MVNIYTTTENPRSESYDRQNLGKFKTKTGQDYDHQM